MIRRLLSGILLLLPVFGFAQNPIGQARLDSMLTELKAAREDTNKVKLLIRIGHQYEKLSSTRYEPSFRQALALSEKLGWKKGIAGSYFALGRSLLYTKEPSLCAEYLYKAIRIFEELNLPERLSVCYMGLGNLFSSVLNDKPKAIQHYLKAKEYRKQAGWGVELFNLNVNLTARYQELGDHHKAVEMSKENVAIMRQHGDKADVALALGNLAEQYVDIGDYEEALKYARQIQTMVHDLGPEANYQKGAAQGLLSDIFFKQKDYAKALTHALEYNRLMQGTDTYTDYKLQPLSSLGEIYFTLATDSSRPLPLGEQMPASRQEALSRGIAVLTRYARICEDIGLYTNLSNVYRSLSEAYALQGNYRNAYQAQQKHLQYRDSVLTQEATDQIARQEMKFEFDKKLLSDSLRTVERHKVAQADLRRQRTISYAGFGGVVLLLLVSFLIYRNLRNQRRSNRLLNLEQKKLAQEKHKSEQLLLNILPNQVAEELKETGKAKAQHFDQVTVLFTDFVNFTQVSESIAPQDLVDELDTCFGAFDEIVARHGLEKIKTIGDAYLAVSGLPEADSRHAEKAVAAALEIRQWVQARQKEGQTFQIRIGLHSGPVVAGIVGKRKFAYDIWGDTVNTAARMEQHGEPGKVNVSAATLALIGNAFRSESRGAVKAKNKGEMQMFFLEPVAVQVEA